MKLSEISKEVKGWLIILIIIYVLAVLTVLVFDPRRISVEKELEGYKKSLNLEAREFAKKEIQKMKKMNNQEYKKYIESGAWQ